MRMKWRVSISNLCSIIFLLLLIHVVSVYGRTQCQSKEGTWKISDKAFYLDEVCPYGKNYQKCQRNGRTNVTYQHYRWRPSGGCDYKKFDADSFGRLWANKKVLVAGDSISRLFYNSLLCMLHVRRPLKEVAISSSFSRKLFLPAYEYTKTGLQIGSVFSKYLVSMVKDGNGVEDYTRVNLTGLDQKWAFFVNDVDVIILQATGWWFPDMGRTYYMYNKKVEIRSLDAYALSIRRVLRYLKLKKFRGTVIMLSHSPPHYKLPKGVAKPGTTCQTNKILEPNQVRRILRNTVDGDVFSTQRNVTRGTVIKFLDVTSMSWRRPDAHIQKWAQPGGVNPGTKDDCLHWCAAGVPANWVELLYNYLRGNIRV